MFLFVICLPLENYVAQTVSSLMLIAAGVKSSACSGLSFVSSKHSCLHKRPSDSLFPFPEDLQLHLDMVIIQFARNFSCQEIDTAYFSTLLTQPPLEFCAGKVSKFSPLPTYNVDTWMIFSLFVGTNID